MKPKLIILNGPLGIGKSTLAKKYAGEHPLTLCLDIDDIWSMISNWREQKDVSAPLSKQMGLEMARVNLLAGNDVIVPQIIQTVELANSFKQLAQECAAQYYEILLITDKEDAIYRFIERGKASGHENGFRPGGVIDTGGREEKLKEMYDAMMAVADRRDSTIKITPVLDEVESTYGELLGVLKSHE